MSFFSLMVSITSKALFGVALLSVSGCVATPFYGRPMTNRIVSDVTEFNKAYAEAANAQILLNVLYSRDRLPRQYAGFKDIATTQTRTLSATPKIGGIPLGNPANRESTGAFNADGLSVHPAKLWGMGEISATGSAQTSPNYGVSPLVGDELNKAAFSATPPDVFLSFWEAGWPKDVLLGVLVSRLQKLDEPKCEPISEKVTPPSLAAENPSEFFSASVKYRTNLKLLSASSEIQTEPQQDCANPLRHLPGDTPDKEATGKCLYGEHLVETASDEKPIENKVDELSYKTKHSSENKGHKEFYRIARKATKNNATLEYRKLKPAPRNKKTFCLKTVAQQGAVLPSDWAHFTTGLSYAKSAGFTVGFDGLDDLIPENDTVALSGEDIRDKFLVMTIDNEEYILTLRSFDQAIYYLGELIRTPSGDDRIYGPKELVSNADVKTYKVKHSDDRIEKGECLAPLFQVRTRDRITRLTGGAPPVENRKKRGNKKNRSSLDQDELWAAETAYRGNWYYAGPASPLKADTDCRQHPVDRSATVLSLLGQIFELNRNPESLRLPARLQN